MLGGVLSPDLIEFLFMLYHVLVFDLIIWIELHEVAKFFLPFSTFLFFVSLTHTHSEFGYSGSVSPFVPL